MADMKGRHVGPSVFLSVECMANVATVIDTEFHRTAPEIAKCRRRL